MVITAIECRAGWPAKIRAPMPTIIVKDEKNMAVLCETRSSLPVLYLCRSPSSMKMLKSSPIPKMKVERMMFTMLNSTPRMPIIPMMRTQLSSIGRKLSMASSMRPKDSHRTKKMRNEEM